MAKQRRDFARVSTQSPLAHWLSLDEAEYRYLVAALTATGGNQSEVSRELGVPLRRVHRAVAEFRRRRDAAVADAGAPSTSERAA
jgi:DNA-binding NtrC family response regulator